MIMKTKKQIAQTKLANKKNGTKTVEVVKKQLKKKLKEEDNEEMELEDSEELNESGSEDEESELEDEEDSDLEDEEDSDLKDEEDSDNNDKDEENEDGRMGKAAKGKKFTKVETPTKRKLEEKGETAIQKKKNRMETREVKVATPDSNKKGIKRKGQEDDIENTVVKKAKPLDDELRALTEKRIKERNSRTLFIRMLPEDVTVAEVKALSPDIVTCRIPIKKKRKNKNVFAFVEFNSEEKSEENFEKLKKKTVRGKQIFVDYTGEKSLTHKPSHQNWDVDKKVLFITNIDPSTTLEDLGEFYPRSSEIKFQKPAKDGHFREAYVKFETEEAAAEAFKKSDNLKMKGNILVVLFAHLKIQTNQSKTKKRKKFQKKQKSENQKEEEYESDSDE